MSEYFSRSTHRSTDHKVAAASVRCCGVTMTREPADCRFLVVLRLLPRCRSRPGARPVAAAAAPRTPAHVAAPGPPTKNKHPQRTSKSEMASHVPHGSRHDISESFTWKLFTRGGKLAFRLITPLRQRAEFRMPRTCLPPQQGSAFAPRLGSAHLRCLARLGSARLGLAWLFGSDSIYKTAFTRQPHGFVAPALGLFCRRIRPLLSTLCQTTPLRPPALLRRGTRPSPSSSSLSPKSGASYCMAPHKLPRPRDKTSIENSQANGIRLHGDTSLPSKQRTARPCQLQLVLQ